MTGTTPKPAASRRSFVGHLVGAGAAAAIVTTGTAVSAQVPVHADAELLRLGSLMDAAAIAERDAWAASDLAEEDEGPAFMRARALQDRVHALVGQIEQHRAVTLAGLLVKMRAITWCCDGDTVSVKDLCPYAAHPTTDIRLLDGLLTDLTAMARA